MWSVWLVSVIMVFILSALWWIKIRGLWKLPDGRDWLWGNLGLVLMGGVILSKSLIQFCVDELGCVPSLLFGLKPNYGRGNSSNHLQKDLCQHCCIQCPWPVSGHCRPTLPPETPGHSQATLGQSLVGSLLLSYGSWCPKGFVCALQESVSPALWKFCNQTPLTYKVKISGDTQSLCQISRLGNLLWVLEFS